MTTNKWEIITVSGPIQQKDSIGLYIHKELYRNKKTDKTKVVYSVTSDEFPKKGKYFEKLSDAKKHYSKLLRLHP